MAKPSARNLMPKKLPHATRFHDGEREHHSSFKHAGVSDHHGGPEWAHGAGDDVHMSNNGMGFGTSTPDEATHMTGIHKGGSHPRLQYIHSMLVRK